MGLDMYLYKETHFGFTYDFNRKNYKFPNDGKIVIESIDDSKASDIVIDLNKISSIRSEVAYWRKAYPIHEWFCKNLPTETIFNGFVIENNKLLELLDICKKIKMTPSLAEDLLPGSDDDYRVLVQYDIDPTIEQLEKIIKDPDFNNSYYIYEASW